MKDGRSGINRLDEEHSRVYSRVVFTAQEGDDCVRLWSALGDREQRAVGGECIGKEFFVVGSLLYGAGARFLSSCIAGFLGFSRLGDNCCVSCSPTNVQTFFLPDLGAIV
jgi:hypothetical protein